MNKVVVALLGIITAVILLIGGFWLGLQMSNTSKTSPAPTPEPTNTPTPTPSQDIGYIQGSLSFPSEGIPENLFVCAETIEGEKIKCTDQQIKDAMYQYGVGYKIEIDVGTYYVYAKTEDNDYKAYYTKFVTCGLSVDCTSHEKIKVDVEKGQTTSNIDPGDWYNQE